MLKFSHFWLNWQNTFYIIWDLYILVSGLQFLQDLQEMNDSFIFITVAVADYLQIKWLISH